MTLYGFSFGKPRRYTLGGVPSFSVPVWPSNSGFAERFRHQLGSFLLRLIGHNLGYFPKLPENSRISVDFVPISAIIQLERKTPERL